MTLKRALLSLVACAHLLPAQVGKAEMEAIYREVQTPYKYGIVLPAPPGKKVDCPNVFRHGDKWYMVYIQLENDPVGYVTRLAESDDLLHWRPLHNILDRGAPGAWDSAQAAGGIALYSTEWGRSNVQSHDGKYWISYLGGPNPGYETPPLSIGLASATDVIRGPWQRAERPSLSVDDADVRPTERTRLFKSFVFRDEARTLGAPFVMFYNAHSHRDSERIFIAVSDDMRRWRRYGAGHVLGNEPPAGAKHTVISGDPQIVRINGLWVMFYFGAFWKPGAFDTFAASRDLVNWTKWEGADLISPSEPWDAQFAHKPWFLKHDGVVYHFYCAVDKAGNRQIALATSADLAGKANAQSGSAKANPTGKLAPKPLYRDPVFDAPTDPVLCYNAEQKKWLMYYTARRATAPNTPGVTWIHGTNIGIAESSDNGATWTYRGTADIGYGKDEHPNDYTYWAPEVIWHEGTYHMYLSYVPGIFQDWNHPRQIVHLTSRDGLKWDTVGVVELKSDRVIDAAVIELNDGTWRMWYKDERKPKALSYADSRDLTHWEPKGNAVTDRNGEGPKVIRWKGKYWLIADTWATGMRVWSSDDATNWKPQDQTLPGSHGDVVISGDRAWWFYFRSPEGQPRARNAAVYVAELQVLGGALTAHEPDRPTYIDLKPERERER